MLRIVVFTFALGFLCFVGCGDSGTTVTPADPSKNRQELATPPPGYSGAAGKGDAPAAASMPPAPVDD